MFRLFKESRFGGLQGQNFLRAKALFFFSLFILSRTRFFHLLWMKNLIVFAYIGIGKRMSSFLYSSYVHCCEMEAFYYLLYNKRFLLLLTLFLLLFRCTLWVFLFFLFLSTVSFSLWQIKIYNSEFWLIRFRCKQVHILIFFPSSQIAHPLVQY